MNKSIAMIMIGLAALQAGAEDLTATPAPAGSISGCVAPVVPPKTAKGAVVKSFNETAGKYTECVNNYIDHEHQVDVVAHDQKDVANAKLAESSIATVTAEYKDWLVAVNKVEAEKAADKAAKTSMTPTTTPTPADIVSASVKPKSRRGRLLFIA